MSTIPPPPPPPPTLPRADNSQASSLCPQPPPPPSGDHSPHTIHADILLSTKAGGNISQSHPSGVNSPKRPGDSTSSSPDFNFRSEEPTGEADPGDVVELPKQASVSVLQIASSQADVGSAHHSVSEQLMGEDEANNGVMKKSTVRHSLPRSVPKDPLFL